MISAWRKVSTFSTPGSPKFNLDLTWCRSRTGSRNKYYTRFNLLEDDIHPIGQSLVMKFESANYERFVNSKIHVPKEDQTIRWAEENNPHHQLRKKMQHYLKNLGNVKYALKRLEPRQ